MATLARQKCFFHGSREAAGICLDCGRYFCRECLTEHDSRVICASCLENHTSSVKKTSGFALIRCTGYFLVAFVLLWFVFYRFGMTLAELPSSFHEGTLWKDLWQNLN